jgi:predicted XRE-type DNA-binding protein
MMAIKKSSGDLFEDLGLSAPEAGNLRVRAWLMAKISRWINENGYKQKQAAEVLGITQSRVSDLMTGKIQKFTVDNLLTMMSVIGYEIEPVESGTASSLVLTERAA